MQCTMYSVRHKLYVVRCMLYSVNCRTAYVVRRMMQYTVHYSLIRKTLFNVQYTLYSVYTVYILLCILYNVHRKYIKTSQ